jgi:site-specific DNA recombinase
MSPRSAQKGGIITALVYTRVSSEEQERDGLSLPSQLMDCRQYASYQGWVIGAEFTDNDERQA